MGHLSKKESFLHHEKMICLVLGKTDIFPSVHLTKQHYLCAWYVCVDGRRIPKTGVLQLSFLGQQYFYPTPFNSPPVQFDIPIHLSRIKRILILFCPAK